MSRHDRARFFAFGILPLLNVVAMLLYGLQLATHGRGWTAAALPLLVVLAFLVLLIVPWAAVKRGHDLGWPAWVSLATAIGGLLLGPAILVLAIYFVFAKGQPESNDHGPPPGPATLATWSGAAGILALPWAVFAVAGRAMG